MYLHTHRVNADGIWWGVEQIDTYSIFCIYMCTDSESKPNMIIMLKYFLQLPTKSQDRSSLLSEDVFENCGN